MRFVALEIVTPPAGQVVTVAEFTAHARLGGITVGREPDLIERELAAATRRCQNWCRRSFLEQTIKARYVPQTQQVTLSASLIALPRGPAKSITSVTVAGAALAVDGWTFDGWNVISLTSPPGGVAVVEWISAGYGADAAAVPDGVKEGILEYATVLYSDREGQREINATADVGSGVPPGVADILREFQIEIFG